MILASDSSMIRCSMGLEEGLLVGVEEVCSMTLLEDLLMDVVEAYSMTLAGSHSELHHLQEYHLVVRHLADDTTSLVIADSFVTSAGNVLLQIIPGNQVICLSE